MSSTTATQSTTASGLAANQARLEAAAQHNAQVSTERRQRQNSAATERDQDGEASRLRVQTSQEHRQQETRREALRASQTQREQELTDQHTAVYQFQAHVQTIKTQGSVVGSLLDMTA